MIQVFCDSFLDHFLTSYSGFGGGASIDALATQVFKV